LQEILSKIIFKNNSGGKGEKLLQLLKNIFNYYLRNVTSTIIITKNYYPEIIKFIKHESRRFEKMSKKLFYKISIEFLINFINNLII